MRRTSIQQAGTATTTSARPKPQGRRKRTRSSASCMVSRIRSSPVMPRCAAPLLRNCAISEDDTKFTSTSPGRPAIVALVAARRAGCARRQARPWPARRRTAPSAGPWRAGRGRAGRSCRRPAEHREQALGVDAGADGRHLRGGADVAEQAVVAAAAGDRAPGAERRATDLRTRSPCSTRGCGRTRRRTRRPRCRRRPAPSSSRRRWKASSAGRQVELVRRTSCAEPAGSLARRAPDRRVALDQRGRLRRQRRLARVGGLGQQPLGDLGQRARADQLQPVCVQVARRRRRPPAAACGSSAIDQLAREAVRLQAASPEVRRASSARNASGRQNWCRAAGASARGMGSASSSAANRPRSPMRELKALEPRLAQRLDDQGAARRHRPARGRRRRTTRCRPGGTRAGARWWRRPADSGRPGRCSSSAPARRRPGGAPDAAGRSAR